jgi:hypothetical protein
VITLPPAYGPSRLAVKSSADLPGGVRSITRYWAARTGVAKADNTQHATVPTTNVLFTDVFFTLPSSGWIGWTN